MPCHAMHPILDLFLEGFSYVLQIDMHFICTPMWTKFYSCKKSVLQKVTLHLPVVARIKAYLHHMVERKIEDIHVVRDFPDVFPDDLSRMPPERAMEFKIEF
jgi:hypothetical protein